MLMTPMGFTLGVAIEAADVDQRQVREMAAVGIIPSLQGPDTEPIGHKFEICGQTFVVTGYATRDEFLAAVEREGLPVHIFKQVPAKYYFQKVSTD
jgi:hypothetical protein